MVDPEEHAHELPECPSAQGAGVLPAELRAWMLLLAATGAVEQRLRSMVKERLGISHDEFLVLCLLAEQPQDGLRMTRVAELLGRPKTRLTYQIACLQHAGLVTRKSVCGDRRGVEVALTDKARRLLGEASDALATTVTDALAHVMGPDQRAAVCGLLPGLSPEATQTKSTTRGEPDPGSIPESIPDSKPGSEPGSEPDRETRTTPAAPNA